MSATHVIEKLPLWIGGDLTEQESLSVQAHLEICPACRAEASAYREAMFCLRMPPEPPFTEEERSAMRLEVMAEVRRRGAPKPTRAMPLLLAAAASIPVAMLFHALYGAEEKPAAAALAAQRSSAVVTGRPAGEASETSETSKADETGKPTGAMVVAQAQTPTEGAVPAAPRVRPANAAITVAQRRGSSVTQERESSVTRERGSSVTQERESSVTRMEFQTENPNIKIIWFTRAGATTNATAKLDPSTTTTKGDSNEPIG